MRPLGQGLTLFNTKPHLTVCNHSTYILSVLHKIYQHQNMALLPDIMFCSRFLSQAGVYYEAGQYFAYKEKHHMLYVRHLRYSWLDQKSLCNRYKILAILKYTGCMKQWQPLFIVFVIPISCTYLLMWSPFLIFPRVSEDQCNRAKIQIGTMYNISASRPHVWDLEDNF